MGGADIGNLSEPLQWDTSAEEIQNQQNILPLLYHHSHGYRGGMVGKWD